MKISQRNQLKSAAREIQTTLLAARIKAVNRNRPVSVRDHLPRAAHRLSNDRADPPAPTPTHVPVNLTLPAKSARLFETPTRAAAR